MNAATRANRRPLTGGRPLYLEEAPIGVFVEHNIEEFAAQTADSAQWGLS